MSTKIAWAEETWNPIVGCSKISPGCDNCYAEKMARRLRAITISQCLKKRSQLNLTNSIAYATAIDKETGKWSGKTGYRRYELEKPLHWKKPRRIFVCSMGDLFHESVPFEWIDKVMAVAALCPQHTFLLLTKRAEQTKEYYGAAKQRVYELIMKYAYQNIYNEEKPARNAWNIVRSAKCLVGDLKAGVYNWPLPNIWLGVTAENQEQADKRIPILLQIPAAKRFVSIEPMLGAVDLNKKECLIDKKRFKLTLGNYLDWVIVGAESGAKRRLCPCGWVNDITKQCKDANVPCFVKQIHDNAELIKMPENYPQEYPKD